MQKDLQSVVSSLYIKLSKSKYLISIKNDNPIEIKEYLKDFIVHIIIYK